jgi:hypothetical protein
MTWMTPAGSTLVRVQLREAQGKMHIACQQRSDDTLVNNIIIQ